IRDREIFGMIRPFGDKILLLNRLPSPTEIRDFSELKVPARKPTKAAESKMAEALINTLAGPSDPTEFKDSYHEQLLTIIKKTAKGKKIKVPTVKEQESKASDLMAMLKASLEKGNKSAS